VYLALVKTLIERPLGLEARLELRAASNATVKLMMTVVLKNQRVVVGYG
jgi:hypothetical protein